MCVCVSAHHVVLVLQELKIHVVAPFKNFIKVCSINDNLHSGFSSFSNSVFIKLFLSVFQQQQCVYLLRCGYVYSVRTKRSILSV